MKKEFLPVILFGVLIFCALDCPAQITSDSLKALIKIEAEHQVAQQLFYPKVFLGISVAGLSVLGLLLWFWRIKKIAEGVVKEKTQNLVESQIAEKVGVKMETLRKYFQEMEKQDEGIRQKRILVVSKVAGKRLELETLIRNAGFAASSEVFLLFRKLSEMVSGIDANKHDLLLIDNFDSQFSETEVTDLIDKYKGSFKLVCFTKSDFDNYKSFSQNAKIVKMEERLGQALIDAVKQ